MEMFDDYICESTLWEIEGENIPSNNLELLFKNHINRIESDLVDVVGPTHIRGLSVCNAVEHIRWPCWSVRRLP